jgi:hypothetical protein
MTEGDDSDFSPASRFSFRTREEIGVHVLSEHVFCPRAALIADESGNDAGDEEPHLGPRLDMFIDYSEHEFTEALHKAWGEMWLWLTLLAPAILIVLLATYLHSPFAGLVLSLPVFLLVAKCWDTLNNIIALVREQARYRAAPEFVIDSELTEITRLSWWSLRKAGFDCNKPPDTLKDPAGKLVGRPWRQLKKGGSIIPVVRRSRGNSEWGRQHEVRIAAYCDLIEKSEGAESPFGVILFSGTSDCVIIPNTNARHQLFTIEPSNRSRISWNVKLLPALNLPIPQETASAPAAPTASHANSKEENLKPFPTANHSLPALPSATVRMARFAARSTATAATASNGILRTKTPSRWGLLWSAELRKICSCGSHESRMDSRS